MRDDAVLRRALPLGRGLGRLLAIAILIVMNGNGALSFSRVSPGGTLATQRDGDHIKFMNEIQKVC